MRIIYTLLILLIFVSCSKDDAVISSGDPTASVSATQVVNATINSDFTYELPLSSPDIQIHKQAEHFTLSKIGVDAKKGNTVYQYVPVKGYTGTDEVTLKDVQTSANYAHEGGSCHNMDMSQTITKTSYIRIKFTVN
jgi:hypothetical protein